MSVINHKEMELRVKELCKERGLRMSDLADRMGVDQANLTSSLKGNPTLSRIQDVARALGVEVSELFSKKKSNDDIDAFVDMGGEVSHITGIQDWMKMTCRLMEFPYYAKVSDMRDAVAQFVYSAVVEGITGSLTGCLLGTEMFCLNAMEEDVDGVDNMLLTLTLFRHHATYTLDQMEYECDGKCDLESDQGMVREICNLIEWQYESCDSATE